MNTNEMVMTRNYKYLITFTLYLSYFIISVNFCITGPSILDLKKIYKTSYSEISYVNTVRSFAYIFGFFNGFAFQYMNRHLGYMCHLLVVSLTMALMPFLPSMNLLYLIFAINGIASAGLESVSDVWIIEMWQKECGPFEQALHFMFAIGSVATTLLVAPFLSEKPIDLVDSTGVLMEQIKTDYNKNNISIPVLTNDNFNSRVHIPYLSGALAIALSALMFGALNCYKPYIPPHQYMLLKSESDKKDKSVFSKRHNSIKSQLMPTKAVFIFILLLGCLLSTSVMLEGAQLLYFPSFGHYSDLHLSEKRAALLSTGFSLAFTVGRGIAIPLSRIMSPKKIIFGSFILISISNYLFLYYSNISETNMWFANSVFGLGVSSLVGSIYSLLGTYTDINNSIGSLYTLMTGLAGSIFPIYIGSYIETNPLILIHFNILMTMLSFILLGSIHILTVKIFH